MGEGKPENRQHDHDVKDALQEPRRHLRAEWEFLLRCNEIRANYFSHATQQDYRRKTDDSGGQDVPKVGLRK